MSYIKITSCHFENLISLPTTQLATEHSIVNARRANREHLNSSTCTISNFQMIKSTPFFKEYLYMSNEDIKSFICTLKNQSNRIETYMHIWLRKKSKVAIRPT